MSTTNDIHRELTHEWMSFIDSWQETRAAWKDDVATQFGKCFVSPWESEMPGFLVSLEALEKEIQDGCTMSFLRHYTAGLTYFSSTRRGLRVTT